MAYAGLLSKNLANSLIEISNQSSVTLDGFILKPAKGERVQQARNSYRLCITISGMQKASGYVGKVLDAAGIYLQHPHFHDPNVPYFNPHYLVRSGGTHPLPTSEMQVNTRIPPRIKLSSDERLKGDLLKVINSSAKGPLEYSAVSPGPLLRTALKPHQVMALSMMVEKESGKIESNNFKNIWSKVRQRNCSVSLDHKVFRYSISPLAALFRKGQMWTNANRNAAIA
ncbi:MAG: hypothetical protein Q9191_002530 [Dirinaria sp. TL-2023a]